MPRLLFITERFPPDLGGLASSAVRLATALCQLGIDVDVVTWSRYLQPGEVLPPKGEGEGNFYPQVYRVGLYRHWDMSMPQTLNVLEWLHESRHYDAVWGHYLFPAGFLAAWFGELKEIPSTVSARGNDIDRGMFPPGDFARLQWTLERASLVTAVSQDLARKIQKLTRREQVLILKNAVDAEVFSPVSQGEQASKMELRTKLGIAEDEVVLGFAGELREKKGQSFLLNALTQVRRQIPACLLIIGEVRAAQEAGLQLYTFQQPEDAQRLIITGHIVEPQIVAEYLRLCDVYLQPSLWEGMPNALLEAMACGCGCIASDAGGIPEVIEHGKNGFLIKRSHLHKLGDAVLEWFNLDAQIKKQIQQEARDRILHEYSLAQEQASLQAIVNLLIPNP